jgi:hypothetical protein
VAGSPMAQIKLTDTDMTKVFVIINPVGAPTSCVRRFQ